MRKQKKKDTICAKMRAAKERKRLDFIMPDYSQDKILSDPLYTLIWKDHIVDKEYIFTLHEGKQVNSFRINCNGQPYKKGGWSKVLEELRKKRIKIRKIRGGY